QPKTLNDLVGHVSRKIAEICSTTTVGVGPRDRIRPRKQQVYIYPQAGAIVLHAPLQYKINFLVTCNVDARFALLRLDSKLWTYDAKLSRIHLFQSCNRSSYDSVAQTTSLAAHGYTLEGQDVDADSIPSSLRRLRQSRRFCLRFAALP